MAEEICWSARKRLGLRFGGGEARLWIELERLLKTLLSKKTKPTPTNPKLKNPLHDLDAQSCFRRLAFSETQELGFRQGSVQQVQVPNLNYVTWRQKWCSQACGHISLLQDFTIAL